MRLKRACTLLLLPCVMFITYLPLPTFSQDAPEIQVDMSVLNQLDPAAGRSRPALARPSPETLIETNRKPVLRPPTASRAPSQSANSPAIVNFPVSVRKRSESFDPSLGMPVEEPRARQAAPIANIPLPELKPIPVAKPRPTTVTKPVASSRTHAKLQIRDNSPVKMPAVPPRPVDSEPLPGLENDNLATSLVAPERQAFLRSVETVAALAEALMPARPRQASRSLSNQSAMALITPPVPARKPGAAPVSVSAYELAALQPAAGNAQTDARPRSSAPATIADAQTALVTLPFTAGEEKLGTEAQKALEQDILPLLRSHPRWRIQIQSYASKTGEGLQDDRRTALSRALAIRSYLLDNGIEARRMDVRALGMKTERRPLDRADLVFFDPNIDVSMAE